GVVEMAGDPDAGRARIHRAVRSDEVDVAETRVLPRNAEQRADAGTGDEPRRIDPRISVRVPDQAQRRERSRALWSLAGVEIPVGAEQIDIAALLGEDAALVDDHA